MARPRFKLSDAPLSPERGVGAATFKLMLRVSRRNPFHIATPRQKLMILAAAIGTAAVLGLVLMLAHLRIQGTKQAHVSPTPCAPGQAGNCIGGTMEVMLLAPAPSPASVPR